MSQRENAGFNAARLAVAAREPDGVVPEASAASALKGSDPTAAPSERGTDLPTMAGWATPTSRDHKDTGTLDNVPVNALLL